jgi:hypothetical protein
LITLTGLAIPTLACSQQWELFQNDMRDGTVAAGFPAIICDWRDLLQSWRGGGVCEAAIQEKHMGSRALVAVWRDEDAARGAIRCKANRAITAFQQPNQRQQATPDLAIFSCGEHIADHGIASIEIVMTSR